MFIEHVPWDSFLLYYKETCAFTKNSRNGTLLKDILCPILKPGNLSGPISVHTKIGIAENISTKKDLRNCHPKLSF